MILSPVALCPRPQVVAAPGSPVPDVDGLPAQGYRLSVRDGAPRIDAIDEAGQFYAETTLAQLRLTHPAGLPDVEIVDWPSIPTRGVMLDVSRDKVPTLETLELLIDRLARLKINHVQLYLEHTFAHPGHEEVWADASPFTLSEIDRLRRYARDRHVELVGQQNALGHMERWLAHDRYAGMAALPGGYRNADGDHEPAACLDPALEGTFELAAELVSNVADAFDAPRIHVGLDEPIDLNPAVWDAIFDVPGAPVPWAHVDNGAFCVPLDEPRRSQYLDWVRRLRDLPALQDREMLMWADVFAAHPELLAQVPEGVTPVEWGYEADHPFAQRCGRLAEAGLPFWVAPGTSSWSSLTGRFTNMVGNVTAAADAGLRHGADGLLVCDWGNEGHYQYLPVSWPGFVVAAARGWNAQVAGGVDVVDALGRYVTQEAPAARGLAWATWQLGRVHDLVVPAIPEAGTLATFLANPEAAVGLEALGMTEAMLREAESLLRECLTAATQAVTATPDADSWRDEARAGASWLLLSIGVARRRLGWDPPRVEELRAEHRRLLAEHERLWLARNRTGGLDRSLANLTALTENLEVTDGIDHA